MIEDRNGSHDENNLLENNGVVVNKLDAHIHKIRCAKLHEICTCALDCTGRYNRSLSNPLYAANSNSNIWSGGIKWRQHLLI